MVHIYMRGYYCFRSILSLLSDFTPNTKCACRGINKIHLCIKQISPGNKSHHNFVVNFTAIIALRFEKVGSTFFKFQSLISILAICCNRRQETVSSQTKVLK